MFNVALIGCGYWGVKLKRYIQENRKLKLTGVFDSKTVEDVWKLDLDAVVVATRNDSHVELTLKALDHGFNVLCEKPLSLTLRSAELVLEMARADGLKVETEFTFTYSRALAEAWRLVNEGHIGPLRSAVFRCMHLGRFGGGSVYEMLGSHWLSVLDMFKPLSKMGFDVFDIVNVGDVVETGVVRGSNGVFKTSMTLSLNHPWKEVDAMFYGDCGTIMYDPLNMFGEQLRMATYERPVWIKDVPRRRETWTFDEANNLRHAVSHFVDVLEDKAVDNLERSVEVSRILDKIRSKPSNS